MRRIPTSRAVPDSSALLKARPSAAPSRGRAGERATFSALGALAFLFRDQRHAGRPAGMGLR